MAFVAIFGTCWLALEPAGLFFPDTFKWGWPGYLALVGVSVIGALITAWPRTAVRRDLPPTDVSVSILVGDVLAQQGNVIVGANDTFDTQFEDDVISEASVQGQLLTRVFEGNRAALDKCIADSIAGAIGQLDRQKEFGKPHRYPIGTVAVANYRGVRYFLPAFSRMSATLPANVKSSAEDLQVALARTWEKINVAGQREPVHAPIIGSNLGRIGLSKTLLIEIIVLSFLAATRHGGPPSLTVWIRQEDASIVDLAALNEWLRSVCVV